MREYVKVFIISNNHKRKLHRPISMYVNRVMYVGYCINCGK